MTDKQESGFPKISKPALRALHGAGYTRLEQLTAVSKKKLSDLHGMGPKALSILENALREQGQCFADEAINRDKL